MCDAGKNHTGSIEETSLLLKINPAALKADNIEGALQKQANLLLAQQENGEI